MKNGTIVSAAVVNQSRTEVTLKLKNGKTVTYSKKGILKINYRSAETEKQEIQLEKENKRLEDERKQKEEATRKAREARQQAARLEKLKYFVRSEKGVWNKMHVDFRTAPGEKPTEEALLENPEIIMGGAPESKLGVLVRSAILPGWGQYKQGRKITGALWFAGFVAAAGTTSGYYNSYQNTRNTYERNGRINILYPLLLTSIQGQSFSPSTDLKYIYFKSRLARVQKKSRNAATNLNNAAGALLSVYLLNLGDVLIFHPTPDQSLSVNFQSQIRGDAVSKISWTWRF